MLRQTGLFLLIILSGFLTRAQDTLPSFSLVNKGNKRIIVSWNNPYGNNIRQLTIQRSFDSTKNFQSILTLPDPTVPQNGYADTKAISDHMFYRLYILLDSGKYVFSRSKRPIQDTIRPKEEPKPQLLQPPPVFEEPNKEPVKPVETKTEPKTEEVKTKEVIKKEPPKPKEIPERIIYIKKRDTLIGQIGERSLKRFKDSLFTKSKDTLSFNTADTIIIRPFVPKEVYKPSKYIFTEKDGNVKIALPEAAEKKYNIRFFEEDGVTTVLDIKQVKRSLLTLDKSNFVHSGWFRFELYEDGKLKEKHKLFIPKDF